nr:uncharacterized protein LOC117682161 isoform X2 [Crassostrea gigas]
MEYISPNICEVTQSMSEAVFGKLIRDLGSSKQVAIRRETEDIREMVDRREPTIFSKMVSGSRREGFRMKESDIDQMHWLNNHRVIMDKSQDKNYNTAKTTLMFADNSRSPPGFTLLRLLTPSKNREILLSRVKMSNGDVYISSSIYRDTALPRSFPNSAVHGPCRSGDLAGTEYDIANCLASDFWPPSASSWVNRCQSWPEPEVVNDILRNGCHFVAIGHPLGLHENEEWRTSFSKAEQKYTLIRHYQRQPWIRFSPLSNIIRIIMYMLY